MPNCLLYNNYGSCRPWFTWPNIGDGVQSIGCGVGGGRGGGYGGEGALF